MGGGGVQKSNVPCLIEVAFRDLVVFGLNLRLFSPRRLRVSGIFLARAVQALECLSLSHQARVLLSQPHHTYAILFHRFYKTTIPQF